jgi:hypothetical protein
MGLFERLRAAEHQGRDAAREGFSRLEEAQSRLRRKMRIRPRPSRSQMPLFVAVGERNDSATSSPIVTINGRDLPQEEPEMAEEDVA